jgi:phosphoribosylaminoimidazole (AIR) synthetase
MEAFANSSLNAELKAIATMEHITGSAAFSNLGAVNGEGWCVTAKVRAGTERPTIYHTFILNTGNGLTVMPNEYSQEEFSNAGCAFYFDDFTEQK